MTALRRLLEFLRITDEDGNLSLTHACLVFAMVCIWRRIPVSLPEFGTLALALGAYQAKKYLAAKGEPAGEVTNDTTPRLAAVEKSVADVASELKAFRSGQAWAAVINR